MKEKIQIKNTLFQVVLGLACYFLFLKSKEKKATLIVGDVVGMGAEYVGKYFKDSEYFGRYAIPESYQKNWWVLCRMLDKIREKFGSAITITNGYQPSMTGIITDSFQMCLSVEIFATNGRNDELYQIIKGMQNTGQITPTEFRQLESNAIRLTIYG